MTCFLTREYDRIQRQLKSRKFERTFDDRHFFPQNWRCDFRWHFDEYRLIHYTIPDESLQFIRDQLKSGRTVHSTTSSEARQFFEKRLRSSPFLMEYVVRLFYQDFKLFNYPIPQFVYD
ncbi:hypothetical protein M3Y94_01001500 [Aphelenchoides besseyi]|nr:hypothetical protein M3Y94_01001500 [Aphelenchoides besseyi]